MNKEERHEFVVNEIETIYTEFETALNQLVILKPFFKDLIAVANGETPTYDLNDIINKK